MIWWPRARLRLIVSARLCVVCDGTGQREVERVCLGWKGARYVSYDLVCCEACGGLGQILPEVA